MKILMTGVNGFIGTHLTERILRDTDWRIQGFDIYDENVGMFEGNERFSFQQGDIFKDHDWIADQVRRCDVVLPLAGIAKPAYYVRKPLWTFELDFEQNLKIVRLCSEHDKRVIFPSTSEIYGLSSDNVLDEDNSPLITGPIAKTRWIYSCSKQMMDRMIFAYGQERDLRFSIFRPFNWVGPRLDSFRDAEKRAARSVTQIVYDVLHRGTISLVDGGMQRRSFTWVGDAMEALVAIIADEGGRADGQIFNVGNPTNNHTIRELAEIIVDEMKQVPIFADRANAVVFEDIRGAEYYGDTYDDMKNRVPSVAKIERVLGWKPRTDMRETVRRTVAWFAEEAGKEGKEGKKIA